MVETEPDQTEAAAVVIGFAVGQMVCDLLKTHGQRFIVVELDPDVVAEARRLGYPILFGDVARAEMLDRLRLGHARALILTMDDPVLSVRVTKRVRGWVPDLPIIARARDADHAAQLYKAGPATPCPKRSKKPAATGRNRAGRPRRRHGAGDRLDPPGARGSARRHQGSRPATIRSPARARQDEVP